jgi:uncharacterized membrane protein
VVCTILFVDVPVARQVLGFVYFTFLPGVVFLKLLKLNELDGVETVLFSVGLSIAFLMIAGLFINEFSFLFGVSQPLSLVPLMIVLNSLILVSGVLVYLKSEGVRIGRSEPIKMSPFALLFLFLPILSIVGAMYVNAYENNLLLVFMIIAISLLFVVGVISKKLLPSKLYPFAVLMITIAILYHSSLISNHICSFGSDAGPEYFLFKTTESDGYWNPTLFRDLRYGRTNAMLSITILPTIYSNLLNIDPIWMFKLLFPLIFSLVPLGLYQIWHTYIGKKYAFISAFLFMAQSTFYTEMLGLNRQIVAELFFVLLLLVIVNKKVKPVNKTIFFMIFSFALVTSHYALAEIFLFFIFFTLVSLLVLKHPGKNITITMIVFFFVAMFTWYIYTSGSTTFASFLEFGDYVYRQLGDFFNPSARGQIILRGLGLESPPTIWSALSRAFAYATQFLIVVGFIGLLTKRVKIDVEREYFLFSLLAMVFLAILILVPGLANTLNMTRFYHILLFFLAPFCAIGAEYIVKLVSKRENELAISTLLLIVLVPYILFQTGFVYEVTGSDSWSIPLSKYRMPAVRLYSRYRYIDTYSAFGAQWFSKNVNVKHVQVYTDESNVFSSLSIYGLMHADYCSELTNTTMVVNNGVVYLSMVNVIHGTVVYRGFSWNTSELSFTFDDLNTVYSNGGSMVYKNPPQQG